MQSKNRTTLILEPKIMETINQIAINKRTAQTKIINDYLKEGIDREPKENKSKIKWIKKPDPSKSMEDLKGIIKTDKLVNAVELINQVRRGE
ncbi:MAG: hypothetical protein LBD03_03165 [Methanobrevibacter sp.]|jgi:hypothetical protein|nr:hypothetical protein [Candidatus Methanovirga procula]